MQTSYYSEIDERRGPLDNGSACRRRRKAAHAAGLLGPPPQIRKPALSLVVRRDAAAVIDDVDPEFIADRHLDVQMGCTGMPYRIADSFHHGGFGVLSQVGTDGRSSVPTCGAW